MSNGGIKNYSKNTKSSKNTDLFAIFLVFIPHLTI